MNIVTKKVKFRTLVIVANIILVVLFQSVYININMKRLRDYAQSAETEAFQTYHTYLSDNFSACMYEVDMLRSFILRNQLNNFVSKYLNLIDASEAEVRVTEMKHTLKNLSVSDDIIRDFIVFGDNFNQKSIFCDVSKRELIDVEILPEDMHSVLGIHGIIHTNMGYLVKCDAKRFEDIDIDNVPQSDREAAEFLLDYLKDEYIVCDYIGKSLTVIRLNKEYIEEKFSLEVNYQFITYHSSGKPILYFGTDEEHASELIDDNKNTDYRYSITQSLYGKLNVCTVQGDSNEYFSFANSKYIYVLFAGVSVLISLLFLYLFSNTVFAKINSLHSTIKKQSKSNTFDYMDVGKKNWKFSTRILVTFLSSCIVSLVVVSVVMNVMIERETREVVVRLGNQLSRNYANECENHYERYESISTAKIEKFLQEFKKDESNGNTELTREFEENFYYETTFLPGYLYAFIVDNSGEVLYQTVFSTQKQVSGEFIRKAILEAKKLECLDSQGVFVPVNDLLSGKETLAFVKSVYCEGVNKGTVVIVSDVPEQPVNTDHNSIMTDFLITDKEDEIIVGKASLYNKKILGKKQMFDTNNKIIYSVDVSTADYIGKSVVLTYYNFYVNQIRAIQYLNLIWSLVIAGVCILATFLLRRVLVKPFNILIASMNATPEKGYQSIPEEFTIDEVDAIAVAYNKMMGRMEYLVEESIRKEAEKSELEILQAQTEFKMLEQQMNPHFLFNTLECVNLLAIRSGEKSISNIVQSLSMILRYAISRETKVKVKREMQVLESYIEIQNFRFGDKISIELNVDESLYELNMIKFVLQPILENAISHGVANLSGNGKIEIGLGCYESGLEFRIKDNGVGMSEERLIELRESLHSKTEDTQQRREGGIGLRNVYRRIALYYKGEGDFIVNSEEGKGTEVIVRLPFDIIEE